MYFQYFKYLLKHKWYVFLECLKKGLFWRGVIHDWSKFLPSEFIPYAQFYYGPNKYMPVVVNAYYKAWLKHQHRNPHHWEYWVLFHGVNNYTFVKMEHKFILEMIADWHGAGRAKHGHNNTQEFYRQNGQQMIMHPIVRRFVENKLEEDSYGNRNP